MISLKTVFLFLALQNFQMKTRAKNDRKHQGWMTLLLNKNLKENKQEYLFTKKIQSMIFIHVPLHTLPPHTNFIKL
jgi:hypothetical protein